MSVSNGFETAGTARLKIRDGEEFGGHDGLGIDGLIAWRG